ncbi:MAG: phage portal protein [Clostridia bacterium]|nr:phage portal protein [Clostridia bacterium]
MASIFSRIFKKKPSPEGITTSAEVIGSGGNVFTAWSGDAYANDIYRGAVDSIARNGAKLKGSHVIKYQEHNRVEGDCKLNRVLQIEPNPYMSAFDMLYKLITHYFLYNNAFAFIQKDNKGQLLGIYPLNPLHVDFMSDENANLYCNFLFTGGKEVLLPYTDIIHLRRNFNDNDLLGDLNTALSPTLQLAHTQNEGIIQAIKSSANIRGILKRNQLSSVDKLKEIQENFIKDYLNIANNGGIAVIDQGAEYIPIDNKPYVIDEKQLQTVKTKIYDYLGISEKIVNSSYTEDEWAAFYESTIEPLAVQFSLEFTRKLFNDRERAFGNSIMFESGRLQFSSNATKINLIAQIMPYGLLTINQALEILNLPAVNGGDIRLQTLNVVNADKAEQYQLNNKTMSETDTAKANNKSVSENSTK